VEFEEELLDLLLANVNIILNDLSKRKKVRRNRKEERSKEGSKEASKKLAKKEARKGGSKEARKEQGREEARKADHDELDLAVSEVAIHLVLLDRIQHAQIFVNLVSFRSSFD